METRRPVALEISFFQNKIGDDLNAHIAFLSSILNAFADVFNHHVGLRVDLAWILQPQKDFCRY